MAHSLSLPPIPRSATLTLVLLLGCWTWRTNPSNPETLLAGNRPPRHVRLYRADGSRSEMWHPQITADSVTGTLQMAKTSKPVSVALADVTRVEVSSFSTGKTVGLVAGVGATVLLVAAVAVAASDWGSWGGGGGGGSGGDGYASCPQVYSWDGTDWRLDSGTFGGAFMEPLELTDFDNLDYPAPVRGRLWFRVENHLDETEYVDAMSVLAVDHPASRTVVPTRNGAVLSLGALEHPVAARDLAGRDALPQVTAVDDWNWESPLRQRDPADSTQIRDHLELSFVRPHGATRATLVLDGHNTLWASLMLKQFIAAHGRETRSWYAAMTQAPKQAQGVAAALAREAFLTATVQAGDRWVPQGLFWEAGPELAKRQALPLDLRQVTGDTVRIRLESIPSFWLVDQVAIAWGAPDTLAPRTLTLASAEDQQGQDVAQELRAEDRERLTLETDDWAELRFEDAPAPPAGLERSYLLRSRGWYRIHTPEAGPVDSTLLAQVASGPGGVSRVAAERTNEALRIFSVQRTGGER